MALAIIWRENNDCRSRDKNGGNFLRLSGVCRSSWIPKLAILLKSNREAQRKSYCLTFSKVLDWRSTAVYSLQNLPVNVQPHFFLLLLSSKFLRSRPRAVIMPKMRHTPAGPPPPPVDSRGSNRKVAMDDMEIPLAEVYHHYHHSGR